MFVPIVSRLAPAARNIALRGSRTYLRIMADINISQGKFLHAGSATATLLVPPLRLNVVNLVTNDIEAASRFAAARTAIIGSCSHSIIEDE